MPDLTMEEIKEQARELAQALKSVELHLNTVNDNIEICYRSLSHIQNGLARIYNRRTIDEIQD